MLAPAGGWEQLFYALHFGADAVYVACDRFGLRAGAANFSLDELPRAVEAAHAVGAKVYVACNVYAHDADMAELPRYARAIERAGADAVIVSDLGVLSVVRDCAPTLSIHVSTQASVSNAEAARVWHGLGARRIVCARELSCAQIAAIRESVPDEVELEAFVHGAMCMAISGRCLISDHLTGRAANQGRCTQPCRWEYSFEEASRPGERFGVEQDAQGSYLFNSKDLNMLAHLDELRRAGIDSFKIEGRAKKAFYVATVVNAYRHVLDGEDAQAWAGELELVSHRPYSTGFYFGPAEQHVGADVYTQLCDWVAEVLDSRPASDGTWRVECRCRNRFFPGDELEVLSPGEPIRRVRVVDLAEVSDGVEVPADKASKAMGRYAFTSSIPLAAHDILRVRRVDPARKN